MACGSSWARAQTCAQQQPELLQCQRQILTCWATRERRNFIRRKTGCGCKYLVTWKCSFFPSNIYVQGLVWVLWYMYILKSLYVSKNRFIHQRYVLGRWWQLNLQKIFFFSMKLQSHVITEYWEKAAQVSPLYRANFVVRTNKKYFLSPWDYYRNTEEFSYPLLNSRDNISW